jgi:hypothetical protein
MPVHGGAKIWILSSNSEDNILGIKSRRDIRSKISFYGEKIKFMSSNRRVSFFVLHCRKTQSAILIFDR